MKKIMFAVALLATMQFAQAQVKSPAAAKATVESAKEAANNPKKGAKFATWIKLAEAYVDAYNSPMGNAYVGGSKQEMQLLMGAEKPSSVENVQLAGQNYVKEVYATKNLYYNENGMLGMIEVTAPVFDYDVLAEAVEAYAKAAELDVKGSKTKDIKAGLEGIAKKYQEEAYNQYAFTNVKGASENFEKAAKASATAPLSKVDSLNYYNAGFTAWAGADAEKALEMFNKCYEIGYYNEDGEVFSKLGEIYLSKKDGDSAVKILEEGFSKYPQSQSILIGLINYYIGSKSNTDRLFSLLDEAKKNEPNNASLYYVEGNIHNQIADMLLEGGDEAGCAKEKDAAVAAYYKASEINPEYEFGFIGAGILYYNQALKFQEKAANEYNDAAYMKLVEGFEKALENAAEPFEKAYAISKDNGIKVSIAEYLKNIFYRFSSKGADYEAKYNKYNEVVKTGVAN
jgi:tetratricopeptide (TPR) repeat protein